MERVSESVRAGVRSRLLAELGPVALIATVLWAKLVHLSVLLPSVSWTGGELMSLATIVGAYPDVVTATLATILLVLAPLLLLGRGPRLAALLAINFGITMLALADLVHVRFYADVTSVSDITRTHMLGWWIWSSVLTLMQPLDALYVADVGLGAVLLPVYARAYRGLPPLEASLARRLGAGCLALGLVILAPTARLGLDTSGIFRYSTLRLEVASSIGLVPYHVSDLLLNLGTPGRDIGPADVERARELVEDRRRRAAPTELFGAAAGSNVLVVSAESIQAFLIGMAIDGQPVMPRMTELARESLYFANHYEPTHLGSTADAEFAVMQSLYPLPVGVVVARYARNDYRALPGVLAERGYQTFSAVGARPGFWNMQHLHPRYGFGRSYYEDSFDMRERLHAWLADEQFFAQMAPLIADQPGPYMGFLLSSSSHHPFDLPPHLRQLRLGSLEGTTVGNYLQAAHYFDRAFGGLLDELRAAGQLDRTLLVVYGDHQAFLGNEPELPALLGFSSWSEYHRFGVVKRTPLIIRLPGGRAARLETAASSHLDVAPTVLGLLGIRDERAVMLGRDLTGPGESLVVFRDGSFADGEHYYVNRFGRALASRCYEAATGRLVDCGPLEARRRTARERLEASDTIVQGNLVPSLASAAR